MNLNKVMLIGRTTKAPEARMTNSGKKVCSFTLAVNDNNKNTDYITCEAWEKLADILEKYVTKGKELYVEGALNIRKGTDDKYYTKVICREVKLGSSASNSEATAEKPAERPAENFDINDDLLPF